MGPWQLPRSHPYLRAMTFGMRAWRFLTGLSAPRVPAGVLVMNPYADARARSYVRAFLDTYFDDTRDRTLVFGINPGRFGAGITGVTFTDPIALADECGIPNDLPRRPELSSVFIYKLIHRLGGARHFHARYFLTAVCPLGFTRDGKNLNYYDQPGLARAVTPFIIRAIEQQIAIGGRRDHAIVLGAGENHGFLRELNEKHGFFERIHSLEHPRFIMQYRRKSLETYLAKYEGVFRACLSASAKGLRIGRKKGPIGAMGGDRSLVRSPKCDRI